MYIFTMKCRTIPTLEISFIGYHPHRLVSHSDNNNYESSTVFIINEQLNKYLVYLYYFEILVITKLLIIVTGMKYL